MNTLQRLKLLRGLIRFSLGCLFLYSGYTNSVVSDAPKFILENYKLISGLGSGFLICWSFIDD